MADLAQFTAQNKYLMLALDHRESFKELINPQNPVDVQPEEVIKIKAQIIESLKDQFSGILIDIDYGLPAYKNKNKPFLLPVEKSGYKEVDEGRITELAYLTNELKEKGASGIKLLLYFNPDRDAAKQQVKTAKKVAEDCVKENLPFFLEIVVYDSVPKQKTIVNSVKYFLKGGVYPDVFKIGYPETAENCQEITGILGETPWILLTAGEDFEIFKSQLQVAIKNGCSGFLAGRALWKELFKLQEDKKEKFLQETLPKRFAEICQIATS